MNYCCRKEEDEIQISVEGMDPLLFFRTVDGSPVPLVGVNRSQLTGIGPLKNADQTLPGLEGFPFAWKRSGERVLNGRTGWGWAVPRVKDL